MLEAAPSYWYSQLAFERALAFIYLVAFLNAAQQFVPLVGARGLLPMSWGMRRARFPNAPTLFRLWPGDGAMRVAAWLGVGLALLALSGYPARTTAGAIVTWTAMWVLYLSFVNAGHLFYTWGWESILLEAGLLMVFVGGAGTTPNALVIGMWRWLLFRVMFGAGVVKLQGDACWRSLTCLDHYFETQPLPNALSWHFHWLPPRLHRIGTALTHVFELGVPFLYFMPQPLAAIGGLLTIAFQVLLIASGNLAWLNWIVIALCIPTLDDRWWSWIPAAPAMLHDPTTAHRAAVAALAVATAVASVPAIRHMLSRRSTMNAVFNPLHFVSSYGMFRFVARTRREIVIEGTADAVLSAGTRWRAYEFRGKPGDPAKRPRFSAPYVLRLDLAVWGAGMALVDYRRCVPRLLAKLLEGDRATLRLLGRNPFAGAPPQWVRAVLYEYRFTTAEERRRSGEWWNRREVGLFMPPVCAASFSGAGRQAGEPIPAEAP